MDPVTKSTYVLRALADSGSAITCGNYKLPFFRDLQRVKRSTAEAVGADGRRLGYVGEAIINIQIEDMMIENVRVSILKNIS